MRQARTPITIPALSTTHANIIHASAGEKLYTVASEGTGALVEGCWSGVQARGVAFPRLTAAIQVTLALPQRVPFQNSSVEQNAIGQA